MTKTIVAKRLPIDPGPAAWKEILPKQKRYPELNDNINTDWLIIGGGFAGLSAAKRICELTKDKVTLIEASEIASGPAGRNSGFMIDLPHELGSGSYQDTIERDKLHVKLNRYALDFALNVSKEYEMPKEAADPVGRINSYVNKSGKNHNQEYSKHLDQLGEKYKELSASDMKEVTGSDFYSGGLFLPGCLMLQPALYISKLAEGISNQYQDNFNLFENTPALEFQNSDNEWIVKTPKAKIHTKKIIMAVNGHAESFGFFKRRLMHVFTYASMTRRLTDDEQNTLKGQKSWGITPSDPMGSTIRRINGIGGDRILIRNRWTFDPSMEVPIDQVNKFGKDQDESFKKRFPMIKEVSMEYRWGGRLCLSLNSVPAFGEVEKNIYSACCQNGIGTAKGTLAGIGAADLAAGINSEIAK
ncbi:MAG: FAD-binding oxidoreductase, partial [Proteobacteria bacterium]|nr:FAD-binding oxidoreductase [Pseudomonadota bacterium]